MSTKNVILTDKNGEQIAPATITDAVAYDDATTLTEKIDELIALASIIDIDSVNIVADLPVNLVNNAMYLIPIIEKLLPAIPKDTGYSKFIIVANVDNALIDYPTATEFYLFAGTKLATRGSYPEDLTQGNANSQTAFSKIYKYTVNGAFEWVEYTNIDWTNNIPIHKLTNVIYASEDIVRNTTGTIVYQPSSNIVNADGSYASAGMPTTFNSYYVVDDVAYRRGVSDLSYIINNLIKIIKPITITEDGTYTADNLNAYGYSPITVNTSNIRGETKKTTETEDEKPEEVKEVSND